MRRRRPDGLSPREIIEYHWANHMRRPDGLSAQEVIEYYTRVDPITGCWEWQAGKSKAGYGIVGFEGRCWFAHRLSYTTFVGPIPEELVLDHFKCTNPGCCNWEHVRPVSHLENALRSDTSVAALNTAKTHCSKGHPLSGENLVETGSAGLGHQRQRACRICRKRIATVINRRNGFKPHVFLPHCKRGHPYSGSNLYMHDGKRHCKQCRNLAVDTYRARLRERSIPNE